MSKLPSLPVYEFTVHTGASFGEEQSHTLTAAYFQESGTYYTVFKDTEHAVVEAYRTDLVKRIVRSERPVDRR